MSRVKVNTQGNYAGADYEFFDAGHIPGAAAVYLKTDGMGILYTGDIKNSPTLMHNAANTDYPPVDVLICESTYGDREHAKRPQEDVRFIKAVKDTLRRGGTVIVPVFALGRSQEMLLMLAKENLNVPIFFDGMANVATDIILDTPESVRDAGALKKAINKARHVRGSQDRMDALKQQSIIVTTSGMLTGGPVVFYLKHLGANPKNSVLITGYQAKETNGRMLLDKGEIYADGWKKKIQAKVEQFDFSAHAGMDDLKALVKKVNPKTVFFVHGEQKSVQNLQEWADAMGYEAYAPELGQIIDL